MMLDAFGDEYRAYAARTGRIVPRLDRLMGQVRQAGGPRLEAMG